MEIVQTMNSDPGLAVGKPWMIVIFHLKTLNYLLLLLFDCKLSFSFKNRTLVPLRTFYFHRRIHGLQRSRLWGNVPREHRDRRWLCRLHLRLPGLLFILCGDVETDRANVLAGRAVQGRRRARNTAQGKRPCLKNICHAHNPSPLPDFRPLLLFILTTRLWNPKRVLESIWGTPSGTRGTPLSRSVCCGRTPET